MRRNDKQIDQEKFDRAILKKITDDEELSAGSKRVNTLGDIFILFLSQSISNVINDVITSMGLDGRIDVLIFLVALSIVVFWVYSFTQKQISNMNKRSKMRIMVEASKIKRPPTKMTGVEDLTDTLLSQLSTKYTLYKHQFVWRRYIINIMEFVAMVSGILMTYYSQKCLSLFLNNLNVSIYTLMLPAIVLFCYFIALKTAFLPYSMDGDYEKILTVDDMKDYMDQQYHNNNTNNLDDI